MSASTGKPPQKLNVLPNYITEKDFAQYKELIGSQVSNKFMVHQAAMHKVMSDFLADSEKRNKAYEAAAAKMHDESTKSQREFRNFIVILILSVAALMLAIIAFGGDRFNGGLGLGNGAYTTNSAVQENKKLIDLNTRYSHQIMKSSKESSESLKGTNEAIKGVKESMDEIRKSLGYLLHQSTTEP